MNLKQILFDGLSKEMERKEKQVMDITVRQAEGDSYQVTFTGLYRQATKVKGSSEMPVPFAVAQTEEQAAKLAEGVLEGRIYDVGRYASVEGTVSPEAVEFNKRYESASVPEGARKVMLALRDVLGPQHKGRPLLNPSTIRYQGQSEDGGQTYKGIWNFNYKPADMATRGTFTMQRKG